MLGSDTSGTVNLEEDDRVATIWIDNPRAANSLTEDMAECALGLLNLLERNPEIRIICLRGSGGRAFCSGANFKHLESSIERDGHTVLIEFMNALRASSKITVAAIEGACVGAGVALAASCDIRLCGASARFWIPAVDIGLGYPIEFCRIIADAVGPSNAREMLLTGSRSDAYEAHRKELVTEVIEVAFDRNLDLRLHELSHKAPLAVRSVKACLDAISSSDEHAVHTARDAVNACFTSRDLRIGLEANARKIRPVFVGE